MNRTLKYPIGEQDFQLLREAGNVYVDKTLYIERLITSGTKYYFLARPRRFGKTLFLSTLQCFFEGKRKLFKGLYADSIAWDWKEYPVLRLDLNTERYTGSGKLQAALDRILREWEERYDVDVKDADASQRFATVLRVAHEKTGLPVVILVDEYDKPLVGNLNDSASFEAYRTQLGALYSNFKSGAQHIRMVFMTGVSRFSKLSIFSDLNNLEDITFENQFADICGITRSELLDNFSSGIAGLAVENGISFVEAADLLKRNYDGYRFARKGSEIYNPWSVLNCLKKQEVANYWNDTGKPTLIAETLKRVDADLKDTFDTSCRVDVLKGLDLQNPDPTALLYQTGYLTIKDYEPDLREFRLGIPNAEVKSGLLNVLLPYYVSTRTASPNMLTGRIVRSFCNGQPDEAMKAIQIYFAGVDYSLRINDENNFHNALFLLMNLIGLDVKAEVHTSAGRIDLLVKTERYIYVIELKYDHSPESALRQIKERGYSRPFIADGRQIFEIGASFSSKTRTVEGWLIEKL